MFCSGHVIARDKSMTKLEAVFKNTIFLHFSDVKKALRFFWRRQVKQTQITPNI